MSESTIPLETSKTLSRIYSSQVSTAEKLVKSKGKTEITKLPLRLKCPEPPEKPRKCGKKKKNLKSDDSSEYVADENEDNDGFCSFEGYENEDSENIKPSDIFEECNQR